MNQWANVKRKDAWMRIETEGVNCKNNGYRSGGRVPVSLMNGSKIVIQLEDLKWCNFLLLLVVSLSISVTYLDFKLLL